MIDNQKKQRLLIDPLFKTHHPQEWKILVELSGYMDSTAQWTDMNAKDIKVRMHTITLMTSLGAKFYIRIYVRMYVYTNKVMRQE